VVRLRPSDDWLVVTVAGERGVGVGDGGGGVRVEVVCWDCGGDRKVKHGKGCQWLVRKEARGWWVVGGGYEGVRSMQCLEPVR
jgi:hypothetical protein